MTTTSLKRELMLTENRVYVHTMPGISYTLIAGIIFSIIVIPWGMHAITMKYSIWSQSQKGQAELSRAEFTRKIVIREAEARMESASLLAKAEIERAKGVAEANKIIGDSLKNNEAYLKYLWIDSLQHTQDKVIYIPTEAGLPILESGRLLK